MAEQPADAPAPVFHVEQRPNPWPRALVVSVFLCCVTACAISAQTPREPVKPSACAPGKQKPRAAARPRSRDADARAPVRESEPKVVDPATVWESDAGSNGGDRHPQP
jgi:hypothetical protein